MTTKAIKPKTIHFEDFPDFKPNLSPEQIFRLGSFGGTYWRPIKSKVTGKNYKNTHYKFPKSWWKGLPTNMLTNDFDNYDKKVNKYKVMVGTTLEFWESKDWITKHDPYGWVMWYCNFYNGRRCEDDERQIKRWMGVASNKGRFRNNLISLINKKGGSYNDYEISPKIRQTLQHWGYQLTKRDFDNYNKK
jgi:hypothetical protein